MALDAAHRASIYEKLRPVLGDEDANVLMSEFPSTEAHELVTKDFLRAELAELRTELHTEIGSVRTELGTEIGSVRAEMAAMQSTLTVRMGSAIAASTALLAAVGILS